MTGLTKPGEDARVAAEASATVRASYTRSVNAKPPRRAVGIRP